jgi:hypothetical protein
LGPQGILARNAKSLENRLYDARGSRCVAQNEQSCHREDERRDENRGVHSASARARDDEHIPRGPTQEEHGGRLRVARQASGEIDTRHRDHKEVHEQARRGLCESGARELAVEFAEHEEWNEADEEPKAHLPVRLDEGELESLRKTFADLGVLR